VGKAEKKAANCLCPGKKVTFATLLTGIYFITILVIISFFPNVQPSPTIEVFNLWLNTIITDVSSMLVWAAITQSSGKGEATWIGYSHRLTV